MRGRGFARGELRVELGSRAWSALYQQAPTPDAGHVFHRDWLSGRFSKPPEDARIVTAVDSSFGKGVASDFSAVVTVAADGAYFYVVDAIRGRWEFNELLAAIKRAASQHGPREVLIEDTASGQSAIQELKRSLPVIAVPAKGSKISRAEAVSPLLEAGKVLFPAQAPPWRDTLIEELASFPAGRFDDMTDALVYALERLRSKGRKGAGVAGSVDFARRTSPREKPIDEQVAAFYAAKEARAERHRRHRERMAALPPGTFDPRYR